ncbi:amidase [Pigmentiphaga aceris]|uniref:Amidase n=1 Tax=Pigmentiphaga aceris TaxID=1940612 RepID=A0A5C0B498_9BURK|nr:amidase [Pigmentiphaga aceris]QEI08686.1 amidase [Pigmentiphaga aceris]
MSVPDTQLVNADAVTLSGWIHGRNVSCRDVMQAFLGHIDRVNPAVNAIVARRDPDELLREAEASDAALARGDSIGWMHGFPQAPKDLAAVRGMVTSQGAAFLAQDVPADDAIGIARMREAGSIFIGRTNTPEFGLGSQSYNPVYGTTGNAYDPSLTGGGSSGGAAVALALRMLPVADGSDMMGSLRNPAAFNNVFGFRPTFGLVPSASPERFLSQLSTDGPMARTVPDLAMLLSVQAGRDARAPFSLDSDPAQFTQELSADCAGKRIGWLGDLDGHLATEPGVLDLCRTGLNAFSDIGCHIEDASLGFSADRLWDSWVTLRHFLVAGRLGGFYNDPVKRAQLKPEAIWEIENGFALTGKDVYAASTERSAWYAHLMALFERYDYLVLPSAQVFAFDAKQHWPTEIAGRQMDTYHRWMEVVIPAALGGIPAISVPVGFDPQGRAMGMQILAKPRDDLALLQLAYAYDLATEWVKKKVPAVLSDA